MGIIRGPDGKITSVTGLQPGQKLIESPSGLRIVTTSAPNRSDRKVIAKSEIPKVIPKASGSTKEPDTGTQKAPIIIRQQVAGNPANVIVKSVTNKSIAPNNTATRSVVLNNGQVLGKFNQILYKTEFKIEKVSNAIFQKLVRLTNFRCDL